MTDPVESVFSFPDVLEETASYIPQNVMTVRDPEADLTAFVVIDSSIDGHACGGMRISPDVSVPSLTALARGMTLKYGFAGIPQGGAKGGILGSQEMPPEKKHALLRRLGVLIAPVLRNRIYISGPDLATGAADVQHMLDAAGVHVPLPRRKRGKQSGYFTALSVLVSMETCSAADRLEFRGRSIAIQGFGSVGSALASLAREKLGMRVVAVSTTAGAVHNSAGLDIDQLLSLREKAGNACVLSYQNAERISNDDLLTLDVDVLAPCAGQYAITLRNAGSIRARYVCPGANNPVSRSAEEVLARNGVTSVPYFAANCGGVFGNRVEVLGVGHDTIESVLRRKNAPRIARMISISRSRGELLTDIAERYAMKRFGSMAERAGQGGLRPRLQRAALKIFNAGIVPDPLVRLAGTRYIERTMVNDPPVE